MGSIKRLLCASAALASTLSIVMPAMAQAPLDCRVVEAVGNAQSAELLRGININIADFEVEFSPRKTLYVHRATTLRFEGCRAVLNLDVTLERRVRRDGKGTMVLSAAVDAVRPNILRPESVCFSATRVQALRLSRTARVGEAIYRRVANRALPNNSCFPVI